MNDITENRVYMIKDNSKAPYQPRYYNAKMKQFCDQPSGQFFNNEELPIIIDQLRKEFPFGDFVAVPFDIDYQ